MPACREYERELRSDVKGNLAAILGRESEVTAPSISARSGNNDGNLNATTSPALPTYWWLQFPQACIGAELCDPSVCFQMYALLKDWIRFGTHNDIAYCLLR